MANIKVRLFLSTGDEVRNCSLDTLLRLEACGKVTLERKRGRIIAAHYRKSPLAETLLKFGGPPELAPMGDCSIRLKPPSGIAESFEFEDPNKPDALHVWNLKLKGRMLNPADPCGYFVKHQVFDAVLLSCIADFQDPDIEPAKPGPVLPIKEKINRLLQRQAEKNGTPRHLQPRTRTRSGKRNAARSRRTTLHSGAGTTQHRPTA